MAGQEALEKLRGELDGPLRESMERLVELQARYSFHFEDPLDKAYRSAAVALLLGSLVVRRQNLEAMQNAAEGEPDTQEDDGLIKLEKQIAEEAHRLKLLGGILPLRAIHKEVRHGG